LWKWAYFSYGFELFTKIYEEEGYNPSEIPQLIIEKEAFKREKDKTRVDRIKKQLADLEDERKQLMALWKDEKNVVENIQKIKEQIENYKYEAEKD